MLNLGATSDRTLPSRRIRLSIAREGVVDEQISLEEDATSHSQRKRLGAPWRGIIWPVKPESGDGVRPARGDKSSQRSG
jgi:hypothetical protein